MKLEQYISRVVAVIAAVATLALALAPIVANMDWTSTSGILAGIVGVNALALKWLHGRSLWERLQEGEGEQLTEHPSAAQLPVAKPGEQGEDLGNIEAKR